MNYIEELSLNAKACICRRLREIGLSVPRFVRNSGISVKSLILIVRGHNTSVQDLQELCSQLLLATMGDEPLWDPLTRRVIQAVVLCKTDAVLGGSV